MTPDTDLTNDGQGQVVTGCATDLARNEAIPVQTSPINIDRNSPTTTCSYSGVQGNNGWYRSSGGVTLNSSDGNGSGVDHTMYMIDNGSWAAGTQFTIPDGPHTVYYYSVDRLNNTEPVRSQAVKVDSTPPAIKAVRSSQSTPYGWYNNSVTVHFTATDDISGLASVSPDVTLSGEGAGQTAVGTAADNAGNVVTYNENDVNIDKTAPSTNYTLEGTPGLNGWNTSNVKVTFSVNDLGPLYTCHSPDNQHWSTPNPYTISDEGSLTVYYYSIDKANNTETVKNFALKIDKTAPAVAYSLNGTHGLPDAFRSDVALGFTANDTGGSGLATASYTLDGAAWKPLANSTLKAEGDYDIRYNASDNAGNRVSGEVKFTIDKTPPTVNTTDPETGSAGVFTDVQPIISFNGRLDPASINNSTVILTSEDGEKVNATLRYVETGNTSTMTVIPLEPLRPYTTYKVMILTDVRDPSGNYLASPYTWTFTTGNMDSAGNELATPAPAPTMEPIVSPTPQPGGMPSMAVIAFLVFVGILAVGGGAFIYFTRIRK